MRKWKVGDLVVFIDEHEPWNLGKTGTVLSIKWEGNGIEERLIVALNNGATSTWYSRRFAHATPLHEVLE